MGKNIGKNISKNVSGKYSQKHLEQAKKLQQMHLKLLQKQSFKNQLRQLVIWLVIKLLTESRKFQEIYKKNNSEAVTNEHEKEIPKEEYMSSEEKNKLLMSKD